MFFLPVSNIVLTVTEITVVGPLYGRKGARLLPSRTMQGSGAVRGTSNVIFVVQNDREERALCPNSCEENLFSLVLFQSHLLSSIHIHRD